MNVIYFPDTDFYIVSVSFNYIMKPAIYTHLQGHSWKLKLSSFLFAVFQMCFHTVLSNIRTNRGMCVLRQSDRGGTAWIYKRLLDPRKDRSFGQKPT